MSLHSRTENNLLKLKALRNRADCKHTNQIEKNHSYGGWNIPDGCLMEYDIYCKDCGKHVGHWETGALEMFDWIYPDDYEKTAKCDTIDFDNEDPFADI